MLDLGEVFAGYVEIQIAVVVVVEKSVAPMDSADVVRGEVSGFRGDVDEAPSPRRFGRGC